MLPEIRVGTGAIDFWVRKMHRRDDMGEALERVLLEGDFRAYQRDRVGRTWLLVDAERIAWQIEPLGIGRLIAVHAVSHQPFDLHAYPNRYWELTNHAGDRSREKLGSTVRTTALLVHEQLRRLKNSAARYNARFGNTAYVGAGGVSHVIQLTDLGRPRIVTLYPTSEVSADAWREAYGLSVQRGVGA